MRHIVLFIACTILVLFGLTSHVSAFRGGFRGGGFRGVGFRGAGFRRGAVGFGFRGGRGVAWRGWRRRGRGWGYWPVGIAAGIAASPYYGYYGNYRRYRRCY